MLDNAQDVSENDEDISNILQKFGKYQIIQYFLICLPFVIIAIGNVNYIFVAGDIDYRCRIPECESLDNEYEQPWWPAGVNRCSKPILNHTHVQESTCTTNSFTSSVSECTEWIYGSNDTIVAWLDLACQPWKSNFVGTIHSLGEVLGMMIGGWCTDRFGRKPTLIIGSVGMVVGIVRTFMKSYYLYIFFELVEAMLCGGGLASGLILAVEISSNDKRMLSGVTLAYAIYFGEALLAGIAVLASSWKKITYAVCAPAILFISYVSLIKESPRWLVVNGKLDEAKNTLKLIAKLNNIRVNPRDIDNMDNEKLEHVCNVELNVKREGFKEVFKSKEIVKILLVAIVVKFSVTLTYYGLVANSVWLSGDKYINYIIVALMSFPGDLLALYFMDKIGRKLPLVYGYFIYGVACIAFAHVPESLFWLKLLLFLVAKLVVSACYTGIWAYTMELYPTSVRGTLFGLCTIASSPGIMLSPLTPVMDTISPLFSSYLFGFSAILSSLALTLTPETKDCPLVGTIEEAVNRVAGPKKIERTNENGEHKARVEEG